MPLEFSMVVKRIYVHDFALIKRDADHAPGAVDSRRVVPDGAHPAGPESRR
jgi:hypothetical protein